MFRPLLRNAIPTPRLAPLPRARIPTRPYTSKPSNTPPPPPRISRLLSRTPRFLHRYIGALTSAPVSHITSFLILHEITAVIPVIGLAAFFHYTHWLPGWFAEGAWVVSGVERIGKYFKKKGWIEEEERREAGHVVVEQQHAAQEQRSEGAGPDEGTLKRIKANIPQMSTGKAWNVGEGGARIVVEFGTAYAITKALLVPRIMFSLWATPAFARWTVVPVMRLFRGLFWNR